MSAITPSTDLFLLKCPIEIDMNNQLTFANKTAQTNYFSSLPHLVVQDISYQRKDGVIRYPAHIDSLLEYNYVMYQNENYTHKWFYAFITHMEYLNDGCTAIYIKTDPYQSYMFDLDYKRSFIEREHVNDDTIGLHTVPEMLEYGEYVSNGSMSIDIGKPVNAEEMVVVFQVTSGKVKLDNGDEATIPVSTIVANRIPQGCSYFGVPLYTVNSDLELVSDSQHIARLFDNAGKADAIVSLFILPKWVGDWQYKAKFDGVDIYTPQDDLVVSSLNEEFLVNMNTTIDSYVPKNNKLFTSPYNCFHVTNNSGSDIAFNYEDFRGTPKFIVKGCVEQGGSIALIPQNSKKRNSGSNEHDAWNEVILAGKFPIVSWASDYYLNWEAVNGTNIELQALNAGLGFLGDMASVFTGDISRGISATASLATNVGNIAQQIKEASIVPPSAKGNVNTGSICFATDNNEFVFTKMSIRSEYAKIIDNYFSAFGYKVSDFKTPNIFGRQNWNYVKTVGANIEGNIPQEYMQEIKQMFDTGVTLWHNPNTFLDYSQNNAIV